MKLNRTSELASKFQIAIMFGNYTIQGLVYFEVNLHGMVYK
jgi:hypothetical protein